MQNAAISSVLSRARYQPGAVQRRSATAIYLPAPCSEQVFHERVDLLRCHPVPEICRAWYCPAYPSTTNAGGSTIDSRT